MAWYNENWKYRRKITINSSLVTVSLNDFTFTLKKKDSSLSENAVSNGSDIIFTDINDQLLNFEIVKFDKPTGELIANIKINVSNSQNTEFYMYFGNSIDTNINLQNKSNANAKFNFVSHLNFNPTLSTIPLDKGPYTNLTKYGTWSADQDSRISFDDSPLGYGLNFDQDDDQFFSSEKLDFTGAETFSIEAWVNRTTTEDDRIIAQGYLTDPATQDFNLGLQNSKIMAGIKTDLTYSASKYGNTNITLNQWNHVAYIWKASTNTLKIILNGNDDGAFIINGNSIDCLYQRQFPTAVKTFIGTADVSNDRQYSGGMSEVRISTDNGYTEEYIKLHYKNVTNSSFYTVGEKEVVSGLLLGSNLWRSDYIDYLKRIKVFIKKEEIIGTEQSSRFPFLLNLYTPCLNETSPYANDIVITDESGERLPFERMLFRQNVNQQRYAAAYLVDFIGQAQLVYDVNAEGTYRCGYLSGVGDYIRFKEVQILNQGIHNLVIRYSNGFGTTQNVDIVVNGITYFVDMPSTGSWSTYATVSVPINWNQKWNIVEIGNTTTAPDIDWIQPLGQETAQLKGFVLLPELKSSVDTEIDIYYKNSAAPIRLNPAYGQAEQVVQAETMTRVSNYTVETNSVYSSGQGLILTNTSLTGVARRVFSGVSGYYDIAIETVSESDGTSTYSIFVNNVLQKTFTTKLMTTDTTRTNHLRKKIWINNGETIEIRSTSSGASTYGRFGLIRIMPTIMDPNTNWNSEEVWGDYEAVWHLDGTPGENRPFYDYSGKERHLFSYNMSAGVNKVQSAIGAGVNFYDDNDRLYGQFDSMDLQNNDFTISAWIQRSPLLDNNRGILITDDLWWRFERTDRIRLTYGNSDPASSQYLSSDFAVADKFLYYTNNFDSSLKRRRARLNGDGLYDRTLASNYTGLNDNITLGVARNQHNIYATDTETFRGLIAEVRISKILRTEDWERNEYKNSMFPQQYIDYDTIFCEENRRDFEIIIAPNGIIITTTPSNKALYVIPRNMLGNILTSGQQLFASLHVERAMTGKILITSNNNYGIFQIIRNMTGGLTTQTNTTAGINWTIEFVRFFTGGILSGSGDVIRVVDFIPDSFGSLSFGYINTSHVIDNGFTIEAYFENAIGGSGFTSGAVFNNVIIYVDSVAGGMSWIGGTDTYEREANYNEINNTGTISVSGSIVNLFQIGRIATTTFPIVVLSNSVIQNNHKIYYTPLVELNAIKLTGTPDRNIIYNKIDNTGSVITSGNAQLNNRNIFIPLVELNAIKLTGTPDRNIIYNKIDNTGGTTTVGNAIVIVVVVFDIIDVGGIIKLSRTLEVVHTVSYIPLTKALVYVSGTVVRVSNYYNITSGGMFNITTTTSSTSVGEGFTLRICYTDNGGTIFVSGTPDRNVTYNKIDNTGVTITSGGYSDNYNDYNIIDNTGSILTLIRSIRRNRYNVINNTGSVITSGTALNTILFKVIPITQKVLTAGLENSIVTYNKIDNNGKIQIDGSISNGIKVYTYNTSDGTIHINNTSTIISTNYNTSTIGIMNFSGTIIRNISYKYIISNPIVLLNGNSDSTSKLECYFDNITSINISGDSWIEETGYNIYYDNFNGLIKTKEGSLVVVFDSTLIPYNKCVKGRVNNIIDLPSMANSTIGDIYYVVNNLLSNWWEYRPSGNYEPIANPFYNTGVLGVYNSINDLPLTGNTIGDVWQIGPCHLGVYYTWNGSNWIEDINYPPIIKVATVSIIAIKSSGNVIVETNYKTTDIEVSGTINSGYSFVPYADYNSTIIGGRINTSGSYDELFINTAYGGNGIITLYNEDIIPIIERNNVNIIFAQLSGSAVPNVIYNSSTSTLIINILGSFITKINIYPDLLLNRIVLSGTEQERSVDREYIPTGYKTLKGAITADQIEYIRLTLNVLEIKLSFNYSSYVLYGESNQIANAVINGSTKYNISFSAISILNINLSGNISYNNVTYLKEVSGNIIVDVSKIIIANYLVASSGKLTWKKNVVANVVVLTEQLIINFVASGGLTLFGYYLNINCRYYNSLANGNVISSGSSLVKLIISNPDYDYGNINISGSYTTKVNYFINTIVILNPIGNFVIKNNYVNDTGTILLDTNGSANNTSNFNYLSVGSIIISKEINIPIVNFIITLVNKLIVINGLFITETNINANASVTKISISGIFYHIVTFRPLISTPRMVLTNISSSRVLTVIVKLIASKILLSGDAVRFTSYKPLISNPIIRTSGSAIIRSVYKQVNEGLIKINNTNTYYKLVISRTSIIQIETDSFYTERTIVFRDIPKLGKIIISGNAITYYKRIYKYLPVNGVIRLSGSAITYYKPTFETIRSGNIIISGGTTDPTEFYLTILGSIKVTGFARVRPFYNNIVSTETIRVYLSSDTISSQYHKFYSKPVIISIKLSGSFITSFTRKYAVISNGLIKLSGSSVNYYIPNYKYSGFGNITINVSSTYNFYNKYVGVIETSSILLSSVDKNYYPSYDKIIITGSIYTSGLDITIEEFSCIYKPISHGIIWDGGAIDFTVSEYVKNDISGTILLGGKSVNVIKKIFYYEATYSHLGSIKIWGSSLTKPSFKYQVLVDKILVTGSNTMFRIGYINRILIVTKIRLSGSILANIQINYTTFGRIILSGSSSAKNSYNSRVSGSIILSGNGINIISVSRVMFGSILINGIAGGNVSIVPEVTGWITISGGINSADLIVYGELSSEINSIKLTPNSKYRTHGDEDLIFHEITHRREYEAGLENTGITYPEEAWSSLQNFNDLLEKE